MKLGRGLVIFEMVVLAGFGILAVVSLAAGEYWIGLPLALPLILPDVLGVGSSVAAGYVVWLLYFLVWLLIPVVSILLNRKKYLAINAVMLVAAVVYPCAFYYMAMRLP